MGKSKKIKKFMEKKEKTIQKQLEIKNYITIRFCADNSTMEHGCDTDGASFADLYMKTRLNLHHARAILYLKTG